MSIVFDPKESITCGKCNRTIEPGAMVHWPNGYEEHINCPSVDQDIMILQAMPAEHVSMLSCI